MPLMNEILDELAGTKYFSKLTMKSGYHQVRMKQEGEFKIGLIKDTNSSNCMAYLRQFCLTRTRYSSMPFGKSCSACWGLNW